MPPVWPMIAILLMREVHPVGESPTACLARIEAVQVCVPATLQPRSATGPPFHHGPVTPTPPDPIPWPVLWARCWVRIQTWQVPPRWSPRDWCDEARAEGALAECLARHEFDPNRNVPLDAFLYRRIVESVWTRHRQEWSFGRRALPDDNAGEREVAAFCDPAPDIHERVSRALEQLSEHERRLIRGLFWDDCSMSEVARVIGISLPAVKKRRTRALHKLRRHLNELV
jgi:RNA polymerase sigma factor (sigma-70 family)